MKQKATNRSPIVEVAYTPVFKANKKVFEEGKYRVIANEGSTRSSKTYSEIQLLIWIANDKRFGKKEISIVSPSLPHLKKGARKDFLEIIEKWGLYNENNFNRTDNVYHFPNTGSYIEFFGVEDAGKVRGPSRDILFVNEANLIARDTYLQLALRTRETIFIDYNPADEYSWVYEVADKEGNKKIHSTYKNNLSNLQKWQIDEIESLKDADENLWRVFGLGLRGTSTQTIYTHWRTCSEMPNRGEQWFGLDFGFQNPTALVHVEEYEGVIYLDELLYESKLTTQDLIDEMMILGVSRSKEIFADCASPGAIEELKRAEYNVFESDKNVLEGIRKVKSKPLRITSKSVNLLKEIKNYKWKQTKDGQIAIPEQPVKFNDHGMDAMRYAIYTKLTAPAYSWTAF